MAKVVIKETQESVKKKSSADIDFDYNFRKLTEAVDKCDNNAAEWIMASTRSNEIAICRKEIKESQYNERRQKISGMVASFAYNCKCSAIKRPVSL